MTVMMVQAGMDQEKWAQPTEATVVGTAPTEWNVRPVEYGADDSVYFNTEAMQVGDPYAFKLKGVPVVAVKRDNGSIDFYELPDNE